jgi:hypothetical protein
MVLAHTIEAIEGEKIARVHCNTCGGQHAYHAHAPGEKAPSSRSSSGTKASKPKAKRPSTSSGTRSRSQVASFDDQVAGKDLATAKPYSPALKFELEELISHPTFGVGIVGVSRPDKIDVTFRQFVKTLVHNRPGGPRPPPTRPTNAMSSVSRDPAESSESADAVAADAADAGSAGGDATTSAE